MAYKSLKSTSLIILIYVSVLFVALLISSIKGEQFVDKALDSELAVVSEKIVSELERYKSLPAVIANKSMLVNFLASQNAPDQDVDSENTQLNTDTVSHLLHLDAVSTESDAIYLLNADGLTVAASNWQDPDSFLGFVYQFRPYYSEAMKGRYVSYFALGTSSGERGFYFSAPVKQQDTIIGVIVLKVTLSTLEQYKPITKEFEYAVSNQDGVIFISSYEYWNYMSLVELPNEVEQTLIEQRQFGLGPIEPLTKLHDFKQILNAKLVELPYKGRQKTFRPKTLRVNDEDWRLIVLAPASYQRLYHSSALMIATLVFLVGYFFVLYLLGVKKSRQILIDNQQELETRVQQRTKQLQETNADLHSAIKKYQQAEADLKQTQNELIQAEKLAVLGEMSAGINHELNQPLTAMRAYAETGLKLFEAGKVDLAQDNMQRILRLSTEMTDIIKKFKVFSRKSTFDTTAVCSKQILDESLQVLSSQINAFNVHIETHCDDNLPLVAADSTLLEQVFVNIIFNAIQALENTEHAQIDISIKQVNELIVLTVEDNGAGFDEACLDQIFTPFYTSKAKGLGLGLTLSRRIVELFGGRLSAANRQPHGAVLSVTLNVFTTKDKRVTQ